MNKFMRHLGIGLLALVVPLLLTAETRSAEAAHQWPTAGWQQASPESAGFDSVKLAEAAQRIRTDVPNTHEIMLIRDGKAVLDATYYPYDSKLPHNLASVTKSVMTTLIAIAADQGKLDLDQPVLSFFADRNIANRDSRKERITVRHLAGMSSGLDCVGEHDEPTLHQMNASADWVQFTLDLKAVAEPGATFSYCSPGMHLLSAILQRATGKTALEFAQVNLFAPLGIKDVIWPADPQGVTHGWGDLHLRAVDAAKLGYLFLHDGEWEGRQIVSAAWVKQASRLQIKTGSHWGDDYGYGWWIMTGEKFQQFAAEGRGGQRVSVFPTLDAVIVTLGGGIDPGKAMTILATAMVDPVNALPEKPEGSRVLQEAISGLLVPPPATAPKILPETARSVSGRTYQFSLNPIGLKTLRLDFDGTAEARLSLTFQDAQPPRGGSVGLDGRYRMSPGENGLPAGIRGSWIDDNTFAAEYDGIAALDAFDLKLKFYNGKVSMFVKERTYESGVTLDGAVVP